MRAAPWRATFLKSTNAVVRLTAASSSRTAAPASRSGRSCVVDDDGRSKVSFESVWARHHAALFRYAHRWTGEPDAAEDVVQEAFARYLRSGVPEDEARPWLFRVAGNLLRDARRRRIRRRGLLRTWVPPDSGASQVGPAAEVSAAREALAGLAERDRTMLLMREEGFSYAEIADVVNVTPSSVGTLLARALRRFKEAYERA
jgi:RNA polymerase sigma factor (sigma-70 family)